MRKNKKTHGIDELTADLFINNPIDKELNELLSDLMNDFPTEKDRQTWLNNKYE